MPASTSSVSKRWISRTRSRVIAVRVRLRSRSWRIGSGGTSEPRTRPWAPSWASHAASETSVFRPGMFFTYRALKPFDYVLEDGPFEVMLPYLLLASITTSVTPSCEKVVPKGEDLVGHRRPGGHHRRDRGCSRLLSSHADLGVSLRDVEAGASWMDHIHSALHSLEVSRLTACDPGRSREFRSLTLVLEGNIPRFSWAPVPVPNVQEVSTPVSALMTVLQARAAPYRALSGRKLTSAGASGSAVQGRLVLPGTLQKPYNGQRVRRR